jgi:CBS domain containing-hemolysin-like protein
MLFYILVLLLLATATVAMLLIKELQALPILERKRRARVDGAHKQLYGLRAHGLEAYILLWGIVIAGLCAIVILVLQEFSPTVAALVITIVFGVFFGWLLHVRYKMPLRLASRCAAVAERLASWCAPVLRPIAKAIRPLLHGAAVHHHIYEKDDLLALIKSLQDDREVRIPAEELKLVEHSLTYGDKLIRYYMTPRRMIKMISADEEISPIMLDELYKSGFSRLPVYSGTEDTIVGILHLKDLLDNKEAKTVEQAMQRNAYYVHEDLSLAHALKAFLRTKHHLFLVVNQFQEVVGLITIEDILEQIIGQKIVDEFDQYDDLRAVAALHAKADRQQNSKNMV